MINSTSSSDRSARTDAVAPAVIKSPFIRTGSDQFSARNSATLRAALAAQPEIRPEVVARGRELAADPTYPSTAVLRQVADKILRSPDLSEEA